MQSYLDWSDMHTHEIMWMVESIYIWRMNWNMPCLRTIIGRPLSWFVYTRGPSGLVGAIASPPKSLTNFLFLFCSCISTNKIKELAYNKLKFNMYLSHIYVNYYDCWLHCILYIYIYSIINNITVVYIYWLPKRKILALASAIGSSTPVRVTIYLVPYVYRRSRRPQIMGRTVIRS